MKMKKDKCCFFCKKVKVENKLVSLDSDLRELAFKLENKQYKDMVTSMIVKVSEIIEEVNK